MRANLEQRAAERSYGIAEGQLTALLSWSKVSFINHINAWKDGRAVDAPVNADGTRGLAWRGEPIVGPNGVAGEWGHNPLPWTSPTELQARPCYCGKTGCQETFLSGTGLCLTYQRLTGEKLTGHEIVERAADGNRAAIKTLEDYLDALARGLAAVINVLDPDVIVLGGGASNIAQIYSTVPTLLPRYVFGGECDTPIVQAVHGDSSGVRGAAWLNPL